MLRKANPYLLALGLILLLRSLLCAAEDWELTCPDSCECKWYNNRRMAVCVGAGFSTIPSRLSSEIQELDLSNNLIQSLGKNAFNMVELINLHMLILSGNRISDIHQDAFSHLRLLMDLDLSNNQIEKLHPKTFTGMEKMRKLILDNNLLSRLEAYQFPELPLLQELRINDCSLSYINTHAFSYLKQLKIVGLRGNKLKVLDPELFISRPHLRAVSLDDNPWVCDCRLRKLVNWIQQEKKGETELACHSPEGKVGKRFLVLDENVDLACPPEVFIPVKKVVITLGGNATLSCGAKGTPPPTIQWILGSRLITNSTAISVTEPHVKFVIHESTDETVYWTNLTVVQLGEDFMLHDYDQSTPFRCKVENPAAMVESNVTLVLETMVESPIITGSNLDIYIIIAISAVGVLVIVLIFLIIACFFRRKSRERPVGKQNGTDKQFMERNNILIVNPVEKPPRKNEHYEIIPAADIELTDLSCGTHKNFEEMNYPEERGGRVRSPLTPLEEEEFDISSQKLLNDSMNTSTTVDFSLQYPDLLDNVGFPRAISPTSYHSLANPMYSPNPEWRYSSCVYPTEFSSPSYKTAQPHLYQQRPGYVTLPRRPRASSLTSAASLLSSSSTNPSKKLEPIYDTLGPRTTADGTSRTDLTRPMSRSMVDPYNLPTPVSPMSPLALNYTSIMEVEPADVPSLSRQSMTLPRSTPNLLDQNGLSIHSRRPEAMSNSYSDNPPIIINGLSSRNDKSPHTRKASPSPTQFAAKPQLSPIMPINNNQSSELLSPPKKKVPPKPPPKPINKRLSIASNASDTNSRQSSLGSGSGLNYQEEGPDGTEV